MNEKRSSRRNLIFETCYMVRNYGKQTTIHGLNRIFAKSLSRKQRLFWALIFIMAVAMLISVGIDLAMRFHHKRLQTVVAATHYKIFLIPFPEIIICNVNRLNWSRLPEAKRKFLNKNHYAEPYNSIFETILMQIDSAKYEKTKDFEDQQYLDQLDYINLTKVVDYMAWRCDEILSDCEWQRKAFNCCDIFLPRYNQNGHCLSFNNVITDEGKTKQKLDEMWPWRTDMYGIGTALNVKMINHNKSPVNNSLGLAFQIQVMQPQVWNYQVINVLPNTKNTIGMKATLHNYDRNTRRIPPKERDCLFQDEVQSSGIETITDLDYMLENCFSYCHQQYFMKHCNCSFDLLFPPNGHSSCTIKDFKCLTKHNSFKRILMDQHAAKFVLESESNLICNCLFNCNSLKYFVDHNQLPLTDEERTSNESYATLDIFYMEDFCKVYRTSLIYTWVDLLVSFGGISVLFLGCSIISAMEIINFLLIQLPVWLGMRTYNRYLNRRKNLQYANKWFCEKNNQHSNVENNKKYLI